MDKVTGKIDIVAHSMGYAFAAGIADALINADILADGNKLGGFYILAPENANARTINNIRINTDYIWQYGTEELGSTNPHLPYHQDGIAPQVGIPEFSFGANLIEGQGRIRFAGDDSNLSFNGSHYGTSYDWVISIKNTDRGHVQKRN